MGINSGKNLTANADIKIMGSSPWSWDDLEENMAPSFSIILEKPMDGRAWWAVVLGLKSSERLKEKVT